MRLQPALVIFLPLFTCCQDAGPLTQAPGQINESNLSGFNPYPKISSIPLPPGFERISLPSNSFGAWLRELPLKKDRRVYLYNGIPKQNQDAQFAVLDISVGNKDLQQCADAVMRLRAEYLYSKQEFSSIDFIDNNKTHYHYTGGNNRVAFDQYLEKVFSYCGTLSLSHQLAEERDFHKIQPGDVLIRGGSPGHAMLVTDVAGNKNGQIIFMLCQSYMPAQDIHIVKNPDDSLLSPWYVEGDDIIDTPEWTFKTSELRKWPQ